MQHDFTGTVHRCVLLKKQNDGAQVPLLLSLGEMEGALTKAIDSGDTDLVYLAIFRLVTTLTYNALKA